MHRLELEVSYHHTDIISSEFQIRQITDLRCVLFVTVVLLPTGLALVYQSCCCRLTVLVLVYETADLGRTHHVPTSVRTDHDELVVLL